MGVLRLFFGWPAGGVWSNLLASLLWGAPAFAAHHIAMRRHVTRQTQAQTEELKEHVTTVLEQPSQEPKA